MSLVRNLIGGRCRDGVSPSSEVFALGAEPSEIPSCARIPGYRSPRRSSSGEGESDRSPTLVVPGPERQRRRTCGDDARKEKNFSRGEDRSERVARRATLLVLRAAREYRDALKSLQCRPAVSARSGRRAAAVARGRRRDGGTGSATITGAPHHKIWADDSSKWTYVAPSPVCLYRPTDRGNDGTTRQHCTAA